MRLENSIELPKLRHELNKYSERRGGVHVVAKDRRVYFFRWNSFCLAEIKKGSKVLGRGVSKRSTTCANCGEGRDNENPNTGATIALWRALDDMRKKGEKGKAD
jgi:hypothetical protein